MCGLVLGFGKLYLADDANNGHIVDNIRACYAAANVDQVCYYEDEYTFAQPCPTRTVVSAAGNSAVDGVVSFGGGQQPPVVYACPNNVGEIDLGSTENYIMIPVLEDADLVKQQQVQYQLPAMGSNFANPCQYQEVRVLEVDNNYQQQMQAGNVIVVTEDCWVKPAPVDEHREKLVLIKDPLNGGDDGDCRLCTIQELPSMLRELESRDCASPPTKGACAGLSAHLSRRNNLIISTMNPLTKLIECSHHDATL